MQVKPLLPPLTPSKMEADEFKTRLDEFRLRLATLEQAHADLGIAFYRRVHDLENRLDALEVALEQKQPTELPKDHTLS